MMIGKTEGTSASFVDYQVIAHSGKNGNGVGNVSEAVRGKTIGERNEAALDDAQKNISDAYTLDISDTAKKRNIAGGTFGSVVRIASGTEWNREDELDALGKAVELYRHMNENYRLTGSPISPEEEQQRMDAILKGFASELPNTLQTAEKNGVVLKEQDFGAALKASTGLEDLPATQTTYTPVTEIRSRHYKWTEENGIEETLSREEEIARTKGSIQKLLAADIGKAIENILTPYETYEKAQDTLYGRETVSGWYSMNENTLSLDMTLKSAQGAFGILANHLNNYLEEFGAEDSFFQALSSALDELDANGDNALVNQIRNMVKTVQGGNAIHAESQEFKEEVEQAISSFYGVTGEESQEQKQKKAEAEPTEQKGMTFLDMQRRAAEEEGRLLDELLGKEHERGFESAGDVLAKRQTEKKDTEFTEKIRHLDEKKEPGKPFEFLTEESDSGTPMSEEEIKMEQAFHDAWTGISERLVGKVAERVDALLSKQPEGQKVDVFG
ncbi:MAG: hypothetical protein IJT01_06210 [Selenomonadaceae bacterium]|nr:hypothetical protein [Selenomonadaceae bacterium]